MNSSFAKFLGNKLPNTLFQKNRLQFINMFNEKYSSSERQIGFFKGSQEVPLYNSDVNYPDYQEGFFYYLFGVVENDCYGIIDFKDKKGVLFVPKMNPMYQIWMTVQKKEDFEQKYELECYYVDEIESYLEQIQTKKVYLNYGINSDSNLPTIIPDQQFLNKYEVDKQDMYNILCHSRLLKNDEEIEAMKLASQVTCEAHIAVMQQVKPGMRESQLESIFKYYGEQNYYTGRVAPYISICGCGHGAATLHYQDNDKFIKDGETMLTDQGHSIHHYVSDITTCFPVNGKFTQKQKEIYDIVLKASREVMKNLRPGVNWVDMHLLAERTILTGLKELGCLQGDIDEMIEGRVGFLFMPHGLGHLIGLDVHDVGGYTDNEYPRILKPGLKNLRTARVMEKNITITVEPGLYFRDFLLNGEFKNHNIDIDTKYLNIDKIKEYQQEIGGVRIEDVVLVTEDGCENLSKNLPRTTEEIEKCMRGENWAI